MDRVHYIELLGKRYPMCLNLSASEAIEREFGNVKKFAATISDEDGKPFTAVNKGLEILMDAGRTFCRVTGLECPDPLPCRPSDVIMLSDQAEMKKVVEAIFATMKDSTEREVEAQVKNPEATPDR